MLLNFVLGCLFILVCLPILEEILSIISAWSEYVIYTYALKIYKIKKELNPNQEEDQKPHLGFRTDAVGYSIQEQRKE